MRKLILSAMCLALAGCGSPPTNGAGNRANADEDAPESIADAAIEPVRSEPGAAGAGTAARADADTAHGRFAPWQSTAILSASGLSAAQPEGAGRLTVGFGAARRAAEAALTNGSGIAAVGRDRNEECGAGPIESTRYPGGLSLDFQNDRFVGWHLGVADGPLWATRDGLVGIGTRRSQLADARVFHSTLGEEFSAAGVSGILEDGRVVAVWAGVSCNFR